MRPAGAHRHGCRGLRCDHETGMGLHDIADRLKGRFLVFDGPDGAGKSHQRDRLATALRELGVDPVVCRDPGGTDIGNRIRSVLLDYDLSEMDVACETLLFMASRAQLVGEIIRPALAAGRTVLCDRFVSATCAYQGAAGYDPLRVIELARFAIGDTWPDLTIILDLDPECGFGRIGRKPSHAGKRRRASAHGPALPFAESDVKHADAMEARPIEFHRRVRKMFLEVHSYYPRPVVNVAADAPKEDVFKRVVDAVRQSI